MIVYVICFCARIDGALRTRLLRNGYQRLPLTAAMRTVSRLSRFALLFPLFFTSIGAINVTIGRRCYCALCISCRSTSMSFIEGIGDDLLYAVAFLVFIGIVTLAWCSTHVNSIHFPTALFIIERRSRRRNGTFPVAKHYYVSSSNRCSSDILEEEESERASSTPPSRSTPPGEQAPLPSSGNDTQTEHESDNE